MSTDEYVTRAEFEREREAMRARVSKVEARQDKSEARQDEPAAELKQLKELIVSDLKDLRADLPRFDDANGLSQYHKQFYNSALGAADPVANVAHFREAIRS
ncbi:hypothetical protein [Asaia bogorensis]|uniref:hypothetical protein n=1 Tax=Asaia bogorensis TaxID=91915 RepID=UPI000EFD7F0D|nr:hypothetical protein [Asaia bogorensis]